MGSCTCRAQQGAEHGRLEIRPKMTPNQRSAGRADPRLLDESRRGAPVTLIVSRQDTAHRGDASRLG